MHACRDWFVKPTQLSVTASRSCCGSKGSGDICCRLLCRAGMIWTVFTKMEHPMRLL